MVEHRSCKAGVFGSNPKAGPRPLVHAGTMCRIPSMPDDNRIFGEEDPKVHWPNVDVKDRVVLDLGAGDFGRCGSLEWPSTGDYWLQQGAKHVIAVDREERDLDHYRGRDGVTAVARDIDSADAIVDLLLEHVPDVVKVDIEGAEAHFLHVEPDIFRIPRAYAFETHSVDLISQISDYLQENGYVIKWTMQHETGPHCQVVYATR